MNKQPKKQLITLAFLLFVTMAAFSQKEFFRSKQVFTKDQLSNFISSLTIHNDVLFFNANDYNLYAYNKNDGSLKWTHEASYKSSSIPFVQDSIVYAGTYINKVQQAIQIGLEGGKLIKVLPFGPLATKPLIKNGMLYGTAIYDYGCILAYDIKKDTVAWSRFIAHGYSRTPYYEENRIVANAEANNWVALGYDGVLLDTTCAVKANMFVENIPCVKIFTALSHDGKEIKGKLSADIFGNDYYDLPEMITTDHFTLVVNGDQLNIISGKLKLKQQVEISSLAEDVVGNYNIKLLKADDENVWMLYGNHVLQFNHKNKKMISTTDLSTWEPYSVLLDENKIWLVSSKDGLLYGLSL